MSKAYMGASLGEGCSPVVHDGKLILVRDHVRQSYIEVLDAKTGKMLWRENRQGGNGWSTPTVVKHSGKTQIIPLPQAKDVAADWLSRVKSLVTTSRAAKSYGNVAGLPITPFPARWWMAMQCIA